MKTAVDGGMAQILGRHSDSRVNSQLALQSLARRRVPSRFVPIFAWFVSIRGRFPQDPNRMSKIPTAAPNLICILGSGARSGGNPRSAVGYLAATSWKECCKH